MLSKNRIKYIRSLEMKKYRKAEKAFLAEGNKLVNDLLGHFSCKLLIATAQWLEAHPLLLAQETIEVSAEELARASLLKTPQEVLAVFELPSYTYDDSLPGHSLCLALDDVQDPGNLGTIIRIADWFGIEDILCSQGTADAFNPKNRAGYDGSFGTRQAALLRFERIHSCTDRKERTGVRHLPGRKKHLLARVIRTRGYR